jgi:hypothetical protein
MSKIINKAYNPKYNMSFDNIVNIYKSGTTMRYQDESSVISSSTTFEKLNAPNSKTLFSKRILLQGFIKVKYESKAVDEGYKTSKAAAEILSNLRFRKNVLNRQIRNGYLQLNGETFSHQIHRSVDMYDLTGDDYENRYYGELHNSGNADLVSAFTSLVLPAGVVDTNPNIDTTLRRPELVSFTITQKATGSLKEQGEFVFRVSEYLKHYMCDFNSLNCEEKSAWYNLTSFKLNLDIDDSLTLDKVLSTASIDGSLIKFTEAKWCKEDGGISNPPLTARVFFETPTLEAETALLPRYDQSTFYYSLNPVFKTPQTVSLTGLPAFSDNVGTVNVLATSKDIQVDNYNINSIPEYIVIRAFKKTKTATDPDVHAIIDGVTILLGNDDSNLRSFKDIELWKMSAKNGLKYGYDKQRPVMVADNIDLKNTGGMGSMVIIHSSDLNLPANISSAVSINTNLQIELKLRGNHSGTGAQDYEVLVTLLEREVLEIKSGSAGRSKNIVSADEVMASAPQDNKTLMPYRGGARDYKMKIGGYKIGGMKGGATMSLSDLADTVF